MIFLSFILLLSNFLNCNGLKTASDDEVMNLIRTETYAVVLFTAKDCVPCAELETVLKNAEEELSSSLNGPLVKAYNSQLTRLYSPTKEPILVFFRHGIPLLFTGALSEDLIIHTFLNNKEPSAKELNDDSFEHLTQAATGATTGDWFVMFYSTDCVDCLRLQARWEAVGAQLKSRMNVARVNIRNTGVATGKRFQVEQVPAFILFRQGKLYRYQIQKYDVPSFVSFAQDWYKNVKPEKIPHPKTPFDELIETLLKGIVEYKTAVQISMGLSLMAIIILAVLKFTNRSKAPKVVKKGNKDK